MAKLLIPTDSKFDTCRAMELANLIQRAYEQFNCYSKGEVWAPEVSKKLTSSTTLDCDLNNPSSRGKVSYKICEVFKSTQYTLSMPKIVPFGFIAQRRLEDGTLGIFIVFRGTLTFPEWHNNFLPNQVSFLEKRLGMVRSGFQKIYTSANGGSRSLERIVFETLEDSPMGAKVFVTGHSLGAALATLSAVHIATKTGFTDPILYTFGSPRVGDNTFADQFASIEHYRIANSEDVVPTLPPSTIKLKGEEMRIKCTPSMHENKHFMGSLLDFSRFLRANQIYKHTGEPLYFTEQEGAISTNHNLFKLYRNALPTSISRLQNMAISKEMTDEQKSVHHPVSRQYQ